MMHEFLMAGGGGPVVPRPGNKRKAVKGTPRKRTSTGTLDPRGRRQRKRELRRYRPAASIHQEFSDFYEFAERISKNARNMRRHQAKQRRIKSGVSGYSRGQWNKRTSETWPSTETLEKNNREWLEKQRNMSAGESYLFGDGIVSNFAGPLIDTSGTRGNAQNIIGQIRDSLHRAEGRSTPEETLRKAGRDTKQQIKRRKGRRGGQGKLGTLELALALGGDIHEASRGGHTPSLRPVAAAQEFAAWHDWFPDEKAPPLHDFWEFVSRDMHLGRDVYAKGQPLHDMHIDAKGGPGAKPATIQTVSGPRGPNTRTRVTLSPQRMALINKHAGGDPGATTLTQRIKNRQAGMIHLIHERGKTVEGHSTKGESPEDSASQVENLAGVSDRHKLRNKKEYFPDALKRGEEGKRDKARIAKAKKNISDRDARPKDIRAYYEERDESRAKSGGFASPRVIKEAGHEENLKKQRRASRYWQSEQAAKEAKDIDRGGKTQEFYAFVDRLGRKGIDEQGDAVLGPYETGKARRGGMARYRQDYDIEYDQSPSLHARAKQSTPLIRTGQIRGLGRKTSGRKNQLHEFYAPPVNLRSFSPGHLEFDCRKTGGRGKKMMTPGFYSFGDFYEFARKDSPRQPDSRGPHDVKHGSLSAEQRKAISEAGRKNRANIEYRKKRGTYHSEFGDHEFGVMTRARKMLKHGKTPEIRSEGKRILRTRGVASELGTRRAEGEAQGITASSNSRAMSQTKGSRAEVSRKLHRYMHGMATPDQLQEFARKPGSEPGHASRFPLSVRRGGPGPENIDPNMYDEFGKRLKPAVNHRRREPEFTNKKKGGIWRGAGSEAASIDLDKPSSNPAVRQVVKDYVKKTGREYGMSEFAGKVTQGEFDFSTPKKKKKKTVRRVRRKVRTGDEVRAERGPAKRKKLTKGQQKKKKIESIRRGGGSAGSASSNLGIKALAELARSGDLDWSSMQLSGHKKPKVKSLPKKRRMAHKKTQMTTSERHRTSEFNDFWEFAHIKAANIPKPKINPASPKPDLGKPVEAGSYKTPGMVGALKKIGVLRTGVGAITAWMKGKLGTTTPENKGWSTARGGTKRGSGALSSMAKTANTATQPRSPLYRGRRSRVRANNPGNASKVRRVR